MDLPELKSLKRAVSYKRDSPTTLNDHFYTSRNDRRTGQDSQKGGSFLTYQMSSRNLKHSKISSAQSSQIKKSIMNDLRSHLLTPQRGSLEYEVKANKQYFNTPLSNKKTDYQIEVAKDKHLMKLVRSKFNLKSQQKEEEKQLAVSKSQHLLVDQLSQLSEAHKQTMEHFVKYNNRARRHHKINNDCLVEQINSGFFQDLVNSIKQKVEMENQMSATGVKSQISPILFSITYELKEQLLLSIDIKNDNDLMKQLENIIKLSRQATSELVDTDNMHAALIVESIIKLLLVASNQHVTVNQIQRAQEKVQTDQQIKVKFEEADGMVEQTKWLSKLKLDKKKQTIRALKADKESMTKRLQYIVHEHQIATDELKRLTSANAGDEVQTLANIGSNMDQLIQEISSKQRISLSQISSMAKLMDFKTKEKSAVKQKKEVQTEVDYRDLYLTDQNSDQRLLSLAKISQYEKLLITYNNIKIKRIDATDMQTSNYLASIITNMFKEKLASDIVCPQMPIQPFKVFLMNFLQLQCRDQDNSYRQLSKMIKQSQQCLDDGIQVMINSTFIRMVKSKYSADQELVMLKVVAEICNKISNSSKTHKIDDFSIGLPTAYHLAVLMFGLFDNVGARVEVLDFLGPLSESQFMIKTFNQNLFSIALSSKQKALEVNFGDMGEFSKILQAKSNEQAIVNAEYMTQITSRRNSNFLEKLLTYENVPSINMQSSFGPWDQQARMIRRSTSVKQHNPKQRQVQLQREPSKSIVGSPFKRKSLVEMDLDFNERQEQVKQISIFALKKMVLASTEGPNPQRFSMKLRQEFTQAQVDLRRDPNLQTLNGQEFKQYVLDRHYSLVLSEQESQALTLTLQQEQADKIKLNVIQQYCQEKQISVNSCAKLKILGKDLLNLVLFVFKSLHQQKKQQFSQIAAKAQKKEERLHLQEETLLQDQVTELSLVNYALFSHLLTKSNPQLKTHPELLLEAYSTFLRNKQLYYSTIPDTNTYDESQDMPQRNPKSFKKTVEQISNEYRIFHETVKKMRLLKLEEFKQSQSDIQRALHSQTLERLVKQAMTDILSSPLTKK